MQDLNINQIKEDIIPKIIRGDYIVLGRMLQITTDAARLRFRRSNKDAILGMQLIVLQREDLIRSYTIDD